MEKLHRMDGVGPTTGERLRSAGYTSYEEIVKMSPSGLSSQLGISLRSAEYVVDAARSLQDGMAVGDLDIAVTPRLLVRSETQPRMSQRLREGLRRFGENVRSR
jgi:hypothetical protein